MRLFCLPYSGGSAVRVFKDWNSQLPDWIDVRPLELPGRGTRTVEGLHTHLDPLVDDLIRFVLPSSREPYALFGHSLGGLLAFEIARRMEHLYGRPPEHLIISAYEAPEGPKQATRDHLLPDEEFRQRLRELSGTPQEVLENEDLMELVVPILRADFAVSNTYRLDSPWLRLSCPMTVLGGLDDPEAPPHTLRDWRRRTTGEVVIRLLPGNHFFLHDAPDLVHEAVVEALRSRGEPAVTGRAPSASRSFAPRTNPSPAARHTE